MVGTPNEMSTSLSLDNLTNNASVRLSASDAAGCGIITSNEVNIKCLTKAPGTIQASTYELCFGNGFDINAEVHRVMGFLAWYVSFDGEPSLVDSLSGLGWEVMMPPQIMTSTWSRRPTLDAGTLATETIH